MSSKVKVLVRLRPPGKEEDIAITGDGASLVTLKGVGGSADLAKAAHQYELDGLFGIESTQKEVHKEVTAPAVEHVFEGYNSCVFAYGQTGSGKTYNIFGEAGEKAGIVPRVMEMIFERMKKKGGTDRTSLFVSFIENYCENLRDLALPYASQAGVSSINEDGEDYADPDAGYEESVQYIPGHQRNAHQKESANAENQPIPPARINSTVRPKFRSYVPQSGSASFRQEVENSNGLEIHERRDKSVYVKNASIVHIKSLSEVMKLINLGTQARATAGTAMNDHSSRSHCVFSLIVVQTARDGEIKKGILNLVDLAGSERLARSQSHGQRLREAKMINNSLSALGNVVRALNSNANYIPYRDCKLTRLLQDTVGGNSYATLLATIHAVPENLDECCSTLNFASSCRSVSNQPRINYMDLDGNGDDPRIAQLIAQVTSLNADLRICKAKLQFAATAVPGMAELLDNIKPSDINKLSGDMGEGGAAAVSFADAGEIAKMAADVGDLSLLAGEDLASLVAVGGSTGSAMQGGGSRAVRQGGLKAGPAGAAMKPGCTLSEQSQKGGQHLVTLSKQHKEEKERLDKVVSEQRKQIEKLTNEMRTVQEEVRSSKGAQLVAHRQDMECVINQNMGLVQRHQDMLRSVPAALSESSRSVVEQKKIVSEMEEAKRLQLRGMDKNHTEELSAMKAQYESWRQQHESHKLEAEHKVRQLETQLKDKGAQSDGLIDHLHQTASALLAALEAVESTGSCTGKRSGLKKSSLPTMQHLKAQGTAAFGNLQTIVRMATALANAPSPLSPRGSTPVRQRPSSAPAARRPQRVQVQPLSEQNNFRECKSAEQMSHAELVQAVNDLRLAAKDAKLSPSAEELVKLRFDLSQQRRQASELHVAMLAKDRTIAAMQAGRDQNTRRQYVTHARPSSAHVRPSSARAGSRTAR